MEEKKRLVAERGVELVADLGTGLFVAIIPINELREQDINARVMDDAKFKRLVSNIQKRGTLESLPYCVFTDKGIEIVSGHHRVKASREAGLEKVPALLDFSGLTRSQIAAKQLAHNAIAGVDDKDTLREIAKLITDVDDMLESAIDKEFFTEQENVFQKLSTMAIDIEWKTVEFLFLDHQLQDLQTLVEKASKSDFAGIADIGQFKLFVDALEKTKRFGNVKAVGAAIHLMVKTCLEQMGETPVGEELISTVTVNSIFGNCAVPNTAAETIESAIEKMKTSGEIDKGKEWRAIEIWAQRYLQRG